MFVICAVQVLYLQLQERKGRQRVLPGFQRCTVSGVGLRRVQHAGIHAPGRQVFPGRPVFQTEIHGRQALL